MSTLFRILLLVVLAPVCESNHWLRDHNVYRCMHGLPAVRWSTELTDAAKGWSRNPNSHTVSSSSHDQNRGRNIGENLAWGPGSTDSEFSKISPKGWYDEIQFWKQGTWNPSKGFGMNVGHMTQMLWRSTTEIGCHRQPISGMYGNVAVCRYRPSGNVHGRFEHELPSTYQPVKTKETCEAEIRSGQGPSTQTTTATPPAPPTTTETITTTTTDKATAECKCSEDSSCVLYKEPGHEWHDSQFCKVKKSDACNDLRYDAKDNSYSRIPCGTTAWCR